MNLILTMAGRYSRFVDEGYRIPKYLLPWGKRSIISEIIINLNLNKKFTKIYLIANKRDEIYMPHLRDIMKELKIPVENLFLISDTSGQAETAQVAIKDIIKKFGSFQGPMCFHNIDTILYNRDFTDLENILNECDGLIDIFESNNRNYSYVLLENNDIKSIIEKVVISNNATSGFYAFKSSNLFLKYYAEDTLYISDVYQKMIDDDLKLKVSSLHYEKDTVVLGTPSEYLTSSYILDLKD